MQPEVGIVVRDRRAHRLGHLVVLHVVSQPVDMVGLGGVVPLHPHHGGVRVGAVAEQEEGTCMRITAAEAEPMMAAMMTTPNSVSTMTNCSTGGRLVGRQVKAT